MYMSRKYWSSFASALYILPHVFPVHAEHIAEQNKPALRHMHLVVQPTLQPHEIIFKTLPGATDRSVPIGWCMSLLSSHPQFVGFTLSFPNLC